MKTPYDTALRIAERRLDQVRAAIGLAIAELDRIEAAHCAIDAAMARENTLVASDPNLTTERYFVRARDQRARLSADRADTQARLEDLRHKAVEQYGSRTAIESAATGFRAAAEYTLVAAEQAAIDDLTGARHGSGMKRTSAGPPP